MISGRRDMWTAISDFVQSLRMHNTSRKYALMWGLSSCHTDRDARSMSSLRRARYAHRKDDTAPKYHGKMGARNNGKTNSDQNYITMDHHM